jgi:hypothetical protein
LSSIYSTFIVDNSLTFSAGSNYCQMIEYTTQILVPFVFEELTKSTAAGSSNGYSDTAIGAYSGSNFWLSRIVAPGTVWQYIIDNSGTTTSDPMSLNTFYILGVASSGFLYANTGTDSALYSISSTLTFPLPAYLIISDIDGGATQVIQWARVRAYPPNGVMPSVSFGSVQ